MSKDKRMKKTLEEEIDDMVFNGVGCDCQQLIIGGDLALDIIQAVRKHDKKELLKKLRDISDVRMSDAYREYYAYVEDDIERAINDVLGDE